MSVELWHIGDDGLSQRLFVSVEDTFKRSPKFTVKGEKTRTLVVRIPTHVDWKQVGSRTPVFYTVEFSSKQGRNLGVRKGECCDNELEKCASQIVKDAKNAAHKLH